MKTEQEQIEQMITIFKNNREVCHHTSCIKCKYCDDKDCMYSSCAHSLYQAGYGDVTKYKSEREMLGSQIKVLKQRLNNKYVEIEQLKSEFKQLEVNAEILARGVRDFNHENYELTEKVKQAQTDTINTIIEYCENPNHWRELKDCKLFGGKSDDLRDFLNGIFKEADV